VLAVTIVGSLPASADPGNDGSSSAAKPTTSDQAKQAWLDASDKAEIANEDLLTARQHEKTAKAAAAKAKVAVAKASLKASAAESAAVQAAAKYANLKAQLADFASASFRGARLGQLSALLTAQSTSDYLDEVSSLDQVAAHTRAVMAKALHAKKAAEKAAASADAARESATQAKAKADSALAAAHRATKNVSDRKADLDKQVKTYHKLFDTLSAQERAAAMAAQQDAWEQQTLQQQQEQAALLAAREQQANQRAAAANQANDQPAETSPQAKSQSDSSSSSSDKTTASAKSATATTRTKAQIAVDAALTRLGYPYVYGTAGPSTFDCSGLTSWAWRQAGVTIPRTSSGQATLPYVPLDQLQPGDLVTYYSPVHHVALYIGNGQIIDASTESKPIFITSVYRGGPSPTGHRVNY
jgi:cell wall-associated NlpC family hydrolase